MRRIYEMIGKLISIEKLLKSILINVMLLEWHHLNNDRCDIDKERMCRYHLEIYIIAFIEYYHEYSNHHISHEQQQLMKQTKYANGVFVIEFDHRMVLHLLYPLCCVMPLKEEEEGGDGRKNRRTDWRWNFRMKREEFVYLMAPCKFLKRDFKQT